MPAEKSLYFSSFKTVSTCTKTNIHILDTICQERFKKVLNSAIFVELHKNFCFFGWPDYKCCRDGSSRFLYRGRTHSRCAPYPGSLRIHYHDVARVAYHEIIYVIRVMRYLEIHTVRQGVLTTGRGIKDTFAQLQDNRFVFIGRSCFVNLDHVLQLSESEIELDTKERLPVSRKMLPGVKVTILQVWGVKP